jgi:uncharacterized protein
LKLRTGLVLLALCAASSPAARAQGIDCAKAGSRIERAICADPELKRRDAAVAADFRDAVDATQGQIRQALIAQQRSWLRMRDRECHDGAVDCLLASYGTRLAALDALTARISTGNPSLLNVTSVALLGRWKVDGYLDDVSDTDRPSDLPPSGTTLTARPGMLCRQDDDCLPFGLDLQALGAVPNSASWSSELHLPPSTPFYVAYLSGKSAYGLIPRPDGSLLAQFIRCDAAHTRCGPAFQIWTPASPDAAVRVLAQ